MDACPSPGTSCPSPSLSSLSDVSSPETLNTPDTQKSVLFDDDVVEDPLDIAGRNARVIMVVGGLGYVGSHTVLELLKDGYNVLIIDDLSNSYQSVLHRIKALAADYFATLDRSMPELHFHRLDYRSPSMRSILASYSIHTFGTQMEYDVPPSAICNLTSTTIEEKMRLSAPAHEHQNEHLVRRQSKISGVIHFAAFKSVEESIRNPLKYYANNVCGLVDFLVLLQEFGVKNLVFSSSATVYGDRAKSGIPLREEFCVHHPETYLDDDGCEKTSRPGALGLTSPYGRTKFMCEAILADIAKSDRSWSIISLRYFNPVGCHESGLLGEDPRQRPSNLIPVIATVLTGTKPVLEIFGTDWETSDGTAVRDFIHVVDLARGHLAALTATASGAIAESFRTFNLG
ncbi:NAD(P)-binding protein, partial [Mytilinidion resinicola]